MFLNDTATTEIYTLSLHDALPILLDAFRTDVPADCLFFDQLGARPWQRDLSSSAPSPEAYYDGWLDRKSTRLNSSHANISYAVFCLKKTKLNSGFVHNTA